jgi:hypothetical protein
MSFTTLNGNTFATTSPSNSLQVGIDAYIQVPQVLSLEKEIENIKNDMAEFLLLYQPNGSTVAVSVYAIPEETYLELENKL